jgi:AraC-like DNA-binding protein
LRIDRAVQLPSFETVICTGPHYHRLRVTDPEDFAEAIRGSHLNACLLARSPGISELERIVLPNTCLDTASIASSFLFTGEMAADCFSLIYVTACPMEGHSFNFSTRHRSGYIGLFRPGGEIDAFVPAGYANATLIIPQDLLLRELAARFPEMPPAWLVRGVGLAIPAASQRRIDSLLQMRRELRDSSPGWLKDARRRASFEEELIEVFVEALRAKWGQPHPFPPAPRRKRYLALRQIRDHIADQRGGLLRLDDLCVVSGMSRRGLEYLFKDHFGIGVNAFVRCQRLHGARRAIHDASPEPGVVKRIALEWGFWHLGRFSAEYRRLFGENPSDTVRRDR